jgi:predicted nucleic acid-binding protein
MIHFLDTSIIVAATLKAHVHHQRSLPLILNASSTDSFCSVHTIAEVYSVVTRLPKPLRQAPETVNLFLDALGRRVSFVSLSYREYLETVDRLSKLKISGGQIYDALIVHCARKANAEKIYTWNLAHFRAIAPDLAERIIEPEG